MASDEQRKKRRRRVARWVFWGVNVIGLIIAIPVLNAVWPLVKVYWETSVRIGRERQPRVSDQPIDRSNRAWRRRTDRIETTKPLSKR